MRKGKHCGAVPRAGQVFISCESYQGRDMDVIDGGSRPWLHTRRHTYTIDASQRSSPTALNVRASNTDPLRSESGRADGGDYGGPRAEAGDHQGLMES